ncbi:MAG: phosphoesterase, partial [Sphingobacteriales bacterium]
MFPVSHAIGQTTKVIKSGHIDSAQIFKFQYVPIDVPEGVTEIRVKESYNGSGKNVLNMGIYGPEGYGMGNAKGFRGWSGGAKKEFFINSENASTGYIPGKIKSGTWNILIYPSTMIAAGLDWTLEVSFIKGTEQQTFIPKYAKEVVNQTPGWYAGDLHIHTLHSDGKRTEQQLVDEAVDKKLDFIISTEHNTNSANLKWGYYDRKNLLVIPGEEVTTTEFGHWNAIGLNKNTWIEWRYSPADKLIGKYTKLVANEGGLSIINHPFYTPTITNGFGFEPRLFDGIEVWNGNWDALDEKDLQWWDSLLKNGQHILAIGASDTHKPIGSQNNLGSPRTLVYAKSLSKKAILAGLKSGRRRHCSTALGSG